jgi:AhpD family alkylhydroperoxidase
MQKRVNIPQTDPAAYNALLNLETYLSGTNLDPIHKHLIKIRASQVNGCAYCLNMHNNEARKHGESQKRLDVLSAWRETTLFSDEEQAILMLTEEVTLIHNRVSDATYSRVAQFFDDRHIAQLIMAVIAINAWNRMVISTHQLVG